MSARGAAAGWLAACLLLAGCERPVPEALASFGLTPAYGALGLAAAQLTYTAMQTRDALAARRRPAV